MNCPVIIQFNQHSFQTQIDDIVLARLVDIINEPDKRLDKDGKLRTPAVVLFKCGTDKLHFVLDDIDSVAVTTSGAVIKIGPTEVRIKRAV